MNKPNIFLRLTMQLLSFLLSVMLGVSIVVAVLIADLHTLTSSGGIKQLITSVMSTAPAPRAPGAMVGAGGVLLTDISISDQINPEDILNATNDSNALTDMLFDAMQDMLGEDIPITMDQLQTFIDNSTVTDFISDKAAGYVEDMLNGTENTQITAEELVQLVEDNKVLIEETFEIEITEEQMEEIRTNVTTLMEEQNIGETIRTEINNVMQSGGEVAGISLAEVTEVIRILSQDTVLYGAIGLCVVLILLLLAANFYNLPGGMTWASTPCILVGGALAAPILALQFMPEILGEMASYASFVNVLAINHYVAPILGLALLIGSIVWRIVRAASR